jgi:hypothetical protein
MEDVLGQRNLNKMFSQSNFVPVFIDIFDLTTPAAVTVCGVFTACPEHPFGRRIF